MQVIRQTVSILLGIWLAVGVTGPAGSPGDPAIILGVVTHSEGGHVGGTDLSEGSTVYDGDCLSTEEAGKLAVHARTANLQLEPESSVTVRQASGGGLTAELTAGMVVFSAGHVTGMELRADGALLRPATDAPTVANVRVAGPKELLIFARRGGLEFSYRAQSAVIAESAAYRVLLDPAEDPEGAGGPTRRAAARQRSMFVLIAIGAAGVAAAATHIPKKPKHHESPVAP